MSKRRKSCRKRWESDDEEGSPTSPCSLHGPSSSTLDADVHTWSTNTTDYDGGASCSSSGVVTRTSFPSLHYVRPRCMSESYRRKWLGKELKKGMVWNELKKGVARNE
ncbi:hypothetical protein Pcinc_007321 [Petrolisthes cinctipes]|uniref:Uncharacterized protein n=1 Tax=Petrolisthes cinctipes TaxID=88211 RepID=A0AAE1L0K9_PETCI|nr:hypothetical protein Pcinc_007321 [Petrolisthes cinctipes]